MIRKTYLCPCSVDSDILVVSSKIGWWRKNDRLGNDAYVITTILGSRYSSSLAIMDALKAVVAEKRTAIVEENGSSQRPTKYLRRGDIERIKEEAKTREEKERMEQEEAARQEAEDKKAAAAKPTLVSIFSLPHRAFCRSLSLR
jgi:hypothetical protein